MSTTHFTYKELLAKSWKEVRTHAWFLFILAVGVLAVSFLTGRIPIVGSIVSLLIGIVITRTALIITDGTTPVFKDLITPFENYKITWHYFVATMLYVLLIILGMVVFIVPAIVVTVTTSAGLHVLGIGCALFVVYVAFLMVRFAFYSYLIVDNEAMKPLEALKTSARMTKGHFWNILGFIFMFVVLNIVGILLLGIGLLVSIPITILSMAALYRKLHHASHS